MWNKTAMHNLADYDFSCPPELIAQKTAGKGKTRILYCPKNAAGNAVAEQDNRLAQGLQIMQAPQIIDLFNENDLLVVNNTQVIPARLFGETQNGGKVELLLIREFNGSLGEAAGEGIFTRWEVWGKPGRLLRKGKEFFIKSVKCVCEGNVYGENRGESEKSRIVRFEIPPAEFSKFLAENGHIPLPPYINRADDKSDKDDYQTVFAKYQGAVAAPTASLHFNDDMVCALKAKGVSFAEVTLHVGPGTFQNITETEDFRKHKMHSENFEISESAAAAINECKKKYGRIVCVGTTSMRVLETAADENGFVNAQKGSTDIFIYPSYKFKAADGLLTNFHWPKSSLILLASAFYGRENTLNAYKFAVENDMKFFSYGDGMLIL